MASLAPLKLTPQNASVEIRGWYPRGRGPDGSVTGSGTLVRRAAAGRSASEIVVLAVAPNGSAKRLASAEPDPRWEMELSYSTLWMTSHDGSEIVHIDVSDLKESGEYINVLRLTNKGDTVFSVRLPYRGIAMSRRYVDSLLVRGIGVDRARSAASNRIPSVFAPAIGLYVEPKGLTWITMREAGNAASVTMLNRRGVPIGRWKLPPKSDLLAATETHVWLREADADDVQSVARYKISCGGKNCR